MENIETHKIQQLCDGLPTLPEIVNTQELPENTDIYGDSPTTTINAHANQYGELELNTNHFNGDTDQFKKTQFYEKLRNITFWAHETGGKAITIHSTLTKTDPQKTQTITIESLPFENKHSCPYTLEIHCELTGVVTYDLETRPFRNEEQTQKYTGDCQALDADALVDNLKNNQPYVTTRVHELVHDCGVTRARARVQALRELGHSYDEISDRLSISKSACRSYTTAVRQGRQKAVAHLICNSTPPKRILATEEFPSEKGTQIRYLCQELDTQRIWIYTLTDTEPQTNTKETPVSLNLDSESYRNIDDLTRNHNLETCDTQTALAWSNMFDEIDTGFIHETALQPLKRAVNRR